MGKAYLCGTGSGGGSGCHDLYVTAPANVTVSVENGEKKYTKISDSNGKVLFKNLTPGNWTVTIVDGDLVATQSVTIDPEYSSSLKFFGSPITVTYPAGSTCTVTYNGTTTPAPDTSGTWNYIARSTGTFTFECTNGELTANTPVTISTDEQTVNIVLAYFAAPITVTYPAGSTCTVTNETTTLNAPDTSGTWQFIARATGTYTFECTDGTQTASANVSITEDGQTASTTLSYKFILVDSENGVYNSGETSAWDTSHKLSGSTFSLTKNTNGEYVLSVKYSSGTAYGTASIAVDLTGRDTLHMKGAISNGGTHGGYSSSVGVFKNVNDDNSAAEITIGTGNKNIDSNIDVSKLSGTYYLSIFIASQSGSTAKITISELWLE